jgi:4-amino-4-deoxy-L-arabinose transferase-like glycosyltransferase
VSLLNRKWHQAEHSTSYVRSALGLAGFCLLGMLLIALLSQIPATHAVNIGGYDTAYVQGFYDPQYITARGGGRYYLDGSDGSARWSRAVSYLLFPQAGLPGSVTLRLRGWRDEGPPPQVEVWLNGRTRLDTFTASQDWQEYTFALRGGLLKASDVVLELRSETAPLPNDGREVGVLLDKVRYHVAPGASILIIPYPTQLLYGGIIGGLLWLLAQQWPPRRAALLTLGGLLLVGAGFALLTRQPPPLYPYPLRWLLPALALLLAALLALVRAPPLLARRPALLDALALGGIAIWLGAVLLAAQQHITLSVPGVEKDFRVFATRTENLSELWRADGFYNLGYPLLLWLAQPFTSGNPFLAGRLVAALSGALLLLAGWWLARTLLAERPDFARVGALLALLALALNPLVVRYALYVGSDMPFAALGVLALALLLAGVQRGGSWWLLLAGCAAGGAFLVRHLGLTLLAGGLLVVWLLPASRPWWRRLLRREGLLFVAGFVLLATPQLVVNMLDTGQPLYNQQAKNVWLAVYTGVDWGRWGEVPDSISLAEVIRRDPARFLANWWGNVISFLGSGAETGIGGGEAYQLRLLPWPANWLALGGLLGWLVVGWRSWRVPAHNVASLARARVALVGCVLLYVLGVSLAFLLPRFFLPLTAIYAAAAAWSIGLLLHAAAPTAEAPRLLRRALLVGMLLALLLVGGFHSGTRAVLTQQPADEVAAIRLTLAQLAPGEHVLTRLPAEVPVAKYSALAHRTLPWQEIASPGTDTADVLAQARERGAAYLLWDEAAGAPPLPNPADLRVGQTGSYTLYRLTALPD